MAGVVWRFVAPEEGLGEGSGQHLDLQPGMTHHADRADGFYFLSRFLYHCAYWVQQSSGKPTGL